MRAVVFGVALVACSKGSAPPGGADIKGSAAPPPTTAAAKPGDNVAVAANQPTSHADWIRPAKHPIWHKPDRPRNNQEELLYGTWVARTGDYATRSAAMADKVMFSLEGSTKTDVVGKIVDALERDSKVQTSCIWLELEADLTGIRRECAVVNGEPSSLDQNDILTGQKKDFGTRFEWYFDDKANVVRIHFADDMLVPAVRDGTLRQLVFRDWVLKVDKTVGDNTFTYVESFPEHDYTLPQRYSYQLFPHSFTGR